MQKIVLFFILIFALYGKNLIASDVYIQQMELSPGTDHIISQKIKSPFDPVYKQLRQCFVNAVTGTPPSEAVPPVPFIKDILMDRNGNITSVVNHDVNPPKTPPVNMYITLDQKGRIRKVVLDAESHNNFLHYPGYRPLANQAVKAMELCTPLHDVPALGNRGFATIFVTFDKNLVLLDLL